MNMAVSITMFDLDITHLFTAFKLLTSKSKKYLLSTKILMIFMLRLKSIGLTSHDDSVLPSGKFGKIPS